MADGPSANARGEYDSQRPDTGSLASRVEKLEGQVQYLRGFCDMLVKRIDAIERRLVGNL